MSEILEHLRIAGRLAREEGQVELAERIRFAIQRVRESGAGPPVDGARGDPSVVEAKPSPAPTTANLLREIVAQVEAAQIGEEERERFRAEMRALARVREAIRRLATRLA